MASNKDDVSWDDDGFGDFGDEGFPEEFNQPGSGKEPGVVRGVATGWKDGFTGHLKDPRNQVKFAKTVLPEGYSKAIDIADDTASGLAELYHHTLTEAKPVIDATRKLLQMSMPTESKFIPKKWLDAIHKMDESYKAPSEEEINETAIASAMGDIFKVQDEKQDKRYEEQQAKDDARTALTVKSNASMIQTLLGVRTGVERLVGYQDSVNAAYQRKSLELQFRTYFVQRKLLEESMKHFGDNKTRLDAIITNTSIPDSEKATVQQQTKNMFLNRAFSSINDWSSGIGQRLLKNAKQEITTFMQEMGGNMQMLLFAAESAKDAAEFTPGGKFALAGQTLGSASAKWLTGKLAKPLQEALGKNEFIRKWNFNLKNMTGLLGQRTNEWIKSGEYFTPFQGMEDIIRSLMGPAYRRDTEIGKMGSVEDLDKATEMTNLTKRSLEEVIPGWLGKIHHELTIIRSGDANMQPLEWDWETADFSTVEQKAERIREKIYDKRQTDRFTKSVLTLYKKIVPKDTPFSELSKQGRRKLREQLMQRAVDEKKFDPKDWKDDPGEVGEYIRNRFKVTSEWSETRNQYVSTISSDTDNQEFLSEVLSLSEDASKNFPDIRRLLQDEMKRSGPNALRRLGILQQQDGTYFANEDAYRRSFFDRGSYQNLPGVMGPEQQRMAPFLSRHTGGLVGRGGGTRFVSPSVFFGAPRYHVGGVGGLEPGEVPVIIKEGEEVVTPDDPRHAFNTDFEKIVDAFKQELMAKMDESTTKPDVQYTNQLLGNLIMLNSQMAYLLETGSGGNGSMTQGVVGKMHWADRAIHGVLDIGKSIKGFIGDSFTAGNRAMGKAWKGVTSAFNWIKDKADDVGDIMVAGGRRVALRAEGLRARIYVDVNTGKVIESLKDITGRVIRIDREPPEEVLSLEEYATGLYNNYGKKIFSAGKELLGKLWTGVSDPVKGITKFIGDLKTSIVGYIKAPEDVYVQGDPVPRLRAHLMRSGGYRLRANPDKLVQSVADIKGEVETIDGKTLLISSDELNKLVDSEGKPIKTNMEKLIGLGTSVLGKVKAGGKAAWEMAGKAFESAKGIAKDLWTRTKAFMGIGPVQGDGVSFLSGTFVSGSKRLIVEVRRLYNMLNHRLPGEPGEDLPLNIDKDFDANGNLMPGIMSKFRNFFKNFNAKDKMSQFKNYLGGKFTTGKNFLMGKFQKGKDWFSQSGIRERAGEMGGDLSMLGGAIKDNLGVRAGLAKDKAKDFFGKMGEAISTAIENRKEKGRYQKWLKDNANPGDDDGQREGSWQDRITDRAKAAEIERQEVQAEENKKQTGHLSKLVALFTRNNKLQEDQIEAIEEDDKEDDSSWVGTVLSKLGLGKIGQWIGDKLTGISSAVAESAVGTAIGNMISKAGEAIGGLGSKIAGSAVGKAAVGAGRLALSLGGAAVNTALGVGGSLLSSAVGVAGTALGGLAGLIFSPVGLAVGAVAAAGYAGFSMFQAFGKRHQYLTKFRYLQYGFDPGGTLTDGDDEEIETITKLEQMLMPYVAFSGGTARISEGHLQVEDMIKLFDVDTEDLEEVQTWVAWFAARFRPIFLTHMKALQNIGKGRVKLWEIDEKLTTDERIEYLKQVGSFPYDSGPYMIPDNPFPKGWTDFGDKEPLDIEPSDIKEAYEDARSDIEDERGNAADKAKEHEKASSERKPAAAAPKKDKSAADKDKEKDKTETKDWLSKTKDYLGSMYDSAKTDLSSKIKSASEFVDQKVSAAADTAKQVGKSLWVGAGAATAGAVGAVKGAASAVSRVFSSAEGKKLEQYAMDAAIKAGLKGTELAMFLAQTAEESGGFTRFDENLRYNAKRLMDISLTARKKGLAAVEEAVRAGPPAIAELIYGGRKDLGNTEPGDGWKYRGRGAIQLTGRYLYTKASQGMGVDLVNNPDLLNDPKNAILSALWYWKSRDVVRKSAQAGDITANTKYVNGGYINLERRKEEYNKYLGMLNAGQLVPDKTMVSQAGSVSGTPAKSSSTPTTAPSSSPTPPAVAATAKPAAGGSDSASPSGSPTPPATASAAPPKSSASPAKTAAAQSTLAAAAPAAVMSAQPSVPTTQTTAPGGLMPVSLGSPTQVAAAKQRDELAKNQLEVQRTVSSTESAGTLNNLSSILSQQLQLQTSMELSLRMLVDKASMPGIEQAKQQYTTVNSNQGQRGSRINPQPSNGKPPPINMGRA